LINGVIAGLGDGRDKKKRRRLPKERLATIPEFALEEILGDFELREDGSRAPQREGRHQVDRTGHRVNNMGYLIDPACNVVKRDGQVVFRAEEVDSDDEIPAPFCYELKKQQLAAPEPQNPVEVFQNQMFDNDDIIEQQYQKLKNAAKSNRSSVDSFTHATPSQFNKQNKRVGLADDLDDD
jgi:hypothetical protein